MEKPEIDFVDPTPPTDLVITDITVGDGEEASAGNNVSVHYVGVALSTGEEFDASYNRGAPLEFPLGVGMVTLAETRIDSSIAAMIFPLTLACFS